MSEGTVSSDDGWRLDKRIPVTVLVMLGFQTVAVLIWGVRLDSRVTANETSISRLEVNAVRAEAVARLDEKMNGVKEDISGLKAEFGTVKDEMRRMSVRGK